MADEIVDPQGAGNFAKLNAELERLAKEARGNLKRAETAAAEAAAASRRVGGEPGGEPGGRRVSEPQRLSSAESRLRVERGITEELRRQQRLSLPAGPQGYRRGPGGLLIPEVPAGYARTGGGVYQPGYRGGSSYPRPSAGLLPDPNYLRLLERAEAVRRSAYQGQALGGAGGGPKVSPGLYGALDSEADALLRQQQALEQTKHATEGLTEEQRRSLLTTEQAQRQIRGIETAYAQQARALGVNQDAWRRHGALATEAISALGRGRADLRELGFHVTSTIGKFAGWTLAATAVYGVAAAIGQLGTGALDSLEGVNNLQRIITDIDTGAAQQKFRDLAQQFNLPIKDVADTAFGMSKIFQNQEDTFKATEQALFAVKVGELDAATATKYLTAIVAGFGLEANELPALFDTINEAQNRFGGNVGSIIQGVAGAAGAFKNVGGSYRDLIALLQTGTRVTGRTGQELGTGLRRSAEYILRPERRQTIIDLLGIDPQDASIVEVYERAMEEVQKATPAQAAEIAKALSTPELSTGRILPILQSRGLYHEIRKEIAPDEVKGSAERELKRALAGPREELAQFGVTLQRLGSAFATSGFLDPFVAMLKLTNETLNLATKLFEQFSKLPGPLKTALAFMVQIAAVTAVARRFDTGGALFGAEPREGRRARAAQAVLARDPNRALRSGVLQGLTEESAFVQDEQRRVGRELAQARAKDLDLTERYARDVAAGNLTEEERYATQQRIGAHREQILDLERKQDFYLQRQQVVARQQTEFARRTRRGRELAGPVARDLAIYPADRDAARRDITGGTTVLPGISGMTDYERSANLTERQLARQELHTAATAGAVGRLDRALDRGATGMRRFGSTLAAMGASIGAFFGPVEIAILLAVGTAIGIQQLVDKINEENKKLDDLKSLDPKKALAAARKEQGDDSALDKVFGSVADAYGGVRGALTEVSPLASRLPGVTSRDERANRIAEREGLRARQTLEQAQPRGSLLYQEQVRDRLKRRLARAETEEESAAAIDRAWEEYHASIARLQKPGEGSEEERANRKAELARTRDSIRAGQAAIAATVSDSAEMVELITTTDQATEANTALLNQVALRGLSGSRLKRGSRLIAQYRTMAQQLQKSGDVTGAQEWLQAADQLESGLLDQAQQDLQRALATLPESRHGEARRNYIRQMRTLLQSGVRERIRRINDQIEEYLREIRGLEVFLNARPLLTPGVGQGGGLGALAGQSQQQAGTRARQRSLRGLAAGLRKSRKALQDYLKQTNSQIEEAAAEQDEGGYSEEIERFDARTQLMQSRTADSVADAQILVSRTRQRVQMLRQHGASQAEIDRALAENNEAVQQLASAQLQRFQAFQAMNTARFSIGATQGQILRRNLSDARAYAAKVKAQGSNVDPSEYYNAMRSVYEAERALAEFARSQAQELVRAMSTYQQSRTEDPIKQARIKLDEAQKLLKYAKTPAERLQAQAEINNRERDLRQTIQREKYEDITFDAELGKIDRQTEIARLEQLLKTIKGNRDLKREIKRRIHQLKKEAEQEVEQLDVGDVRLPTVYEIRRAVGGVGRGFMVTQNYYTSIDVKRPQDASSVGRVFDDYHSGAGQAVERAMGRR